VVTLKDITEETLQILFSNDLDWSKLIFELEEFACSRKNLPGMETHHIEPEREKTTFLWPLEHLAIHICHAKLFSTDSNHAKVAAFVKPFPGAYNRIVSLTNETHKLVLSFGQRRPSRDSEFWKRVHDLPQSKLAYQKLGRENGAKNGIKGAEKTRGRPRSVPITWGDKISLAIAAKGSYTCPHCGKIMKDLQSNIIQHSRSQKCRRAA
jgi:hypothetical protein